MKSSGWFVAVLLVSMFLFTVEGLPDTSVTISSHGLIAVDQAMQYKGAWTSDPAWNYYGKYFEQPQIDMLTSARGNLLIIAVNMYAWENNLGAGGNVLGLSCKDYVRELVSRFQATGGKAILSMHLWDEGEYDRSMCEHGIRIGKWWSPEKTHVIKFHRDEWINWGKEMISYCSPWGILIMDEPPKRDFPISDITEQEYWEFANESIGAYRSVDPNIHCMLYGGGSTLGHRDLSYFLDHPLPHPNVIYTMTFYYSSYSSYSNLYRSGNLAAARQALYAEIDDKLGPIKAQCIINVGVENTVDYPNWDVYLRDAYEYAEQNTLGYAQWACAKSVRWNLFKNENNQVGVDWMEWSAIGQVWAAYG